ncbi:methionine ABC transporter permease [Bacillus sp. CGMCC 1.16607]|uniref:methionine ABC transporter permease n=1 Tax=Bacillus sp. CGMCC 1.16607 TaxID=3351842 RepID=UPI0036405737
MDRFETFTEQWIPIIGKSLGETFQMVSISLVLSVLVGTGLGILLVLTRSGQPLENKWTYHGLNLLINIIRSVPFIILLFFILPFTKWVAGTTIGVKGVIVPLVIYTAPYISRLVETALLEMDHGVIEAYQAMGIKKRHIIWNVMLRESRSSLVLGLTIATVSLIGATAMAGLVGAGGLGDLAYRFGHLRYEVDVMYATVFILIVIVQSIQTIGNKLATQLKKD